MHDTINLPSAQDRETAPRADRQLRLVVTALRKHKWPIILTAAMATALAALIVYSLIPTYRAKAALLFAFEDRGQIIQIDELIDREESSSEYLQTQVEILRSRQLAADVVDTLVLVDHWEFNSAVITPDRFLPKGPVADFTYTVIDTASKITAPLFEVLEKFTGVSFSTASQSDEPTVASTLIEADEADGANPASTPAISPDTQLTDRNESIVNIVMARTNIRPVKGTNLVRIIFDAKDPEMAAAVANAYARQYVENYRSRETSLNDKATGFLEERVEVLRARLDSSERELLEFQSANGIVNFRGDIGGINEQELGLVTTELLAANRELVSAKVLRDDLQDARAQGFDALDKVPLVSQDPVVQRNRAILADTESELSNLLNRYGDRHPLVVDARSSLQSTRDNLERQMVNVADMAEIRYTSALANVRELEQQRLNEKGEIQQLSLKQLEMADLEREVEINRDLYNRYFNRARESEEASGLSAANATLADPATTPTQPVKPRKHLVLLIVGLGSSILAAGFVLWREDFLDTIKGVRDVERKLGLRVLGVMPSTGFKRGRKDNSSTITPRHIHDPEGLFEEALRTLRTSVLLLDNASEQPNKVILITSSIPGEWKSTVASNLARSLSVNERVLLIEADMRRPGLSHALALTGTGLADLLQGKVMPSECIHTRAIPGVHFLAAGRIDADSPDLLLSPNLKKVVKTFSDSYDRVIIDSAPIQAVSDALIMGNMSDAVFFIVQADSTGSALAAQAVDRLREGGVPLAGAVVSQVDLTKLARYGGDFYYHGFFDKYGYGHRVQTNTRGAA